MMINLGEAEPIDQMILNFTNSISGEDEGRGGRDARRKPPAPASKASPPVVVGVAHLTRRELALDAVHAAAVLGQRQEQEGGVLDFRRRRRLWTLLAVCRMGDDAVRLGYRWMATSG